MLHRRGHLSDGLGDCPIASNGPYLPPNPSKEQEPASALQVVEMVFYAQALREQFDTRSSSKRQLACPSPRATLRSSLAAKMPCVSQEKDHEAFLSIRV